MTIKEIAEKISISPGTIDRVIHNRGRVDKKTAEYIKQKLIEYNYVPNPNGQTLAGIRKRFKVAVILPDFDDEFSKLLFRGLTDNYSVLENSGVNIIECKYQGNNKDDCKKEFSRMLKEQVNAIVFYAPSSYFAEDLIKEAKKKNCFVVVLNSRVRGNDHGAYCGHNNYVSGRVSMQMLCASLPEKSNIYVFAGSPQEISHKERIDGALDYLRSQKKDYNLIAQQCVVPGIGYEGALKIFREQCNGKRIDGVLNFTIFPFVMDVIKDNELSKEAIVVGFDLTQAHIEQLKNGEYTFLVGRKILLQKEQHTL